MTKIEKQMLAVIIIFVILTFFWGTMAIHSFNQMEQNGGLKAVVEHIWEGDKK